MTRNSASCETASRPLQARIGFAARKPGFFATVIDHLVEWQERNRSRVLLGRMDDRMLRDMGISRSDVDVELSKPFWRA